PPTGLCKLTFSTEVATSEPDPQLLILGYTVLDSIVPVPPLGIACVPFFLPGSILTQVNGSIDETHTFLSLIDNPQIAFPIWIVTGRDIVPCIASAFGGQFRLRRHCLLVECQTQ